MVIWSIERSCAVGGRYPPIECHCDHSEDSAVSRVMPITAVVHAYPRGYWREVVFRNIVDCSGFVVGVGVGVVSMNYADFALGYLAVAFEYCDVFGVGGDGAAFKEDEGVCVVASLL